MTSINHRYVWRIDLRRKDHSILVRLQIRNRLMEQLCELGFAVRIEPEHLHSAFSLHASHNRESAITLALLKYSDTIERVERLV